MKTIPFATVAASLVGALALGGPVHAQEAYPNKPIRLITPTQPG
jgi:tripartite-type tricarboxylate transporter receptor subunit TctC